MSDTNALRTRIASELNRALTDSFGNSGETFATVVNREINAAIKHYESAAFRWNRKRRSEIITTANGTTNYSLPPSFISMRKLEIIYQGYFYEICKGSPEDIDCLNYRASMTAGAVSIPLKHTIDGNILVIAPPANAALTLAASYVYRVPATSLTGSYTAVIPIAGSYSFTVTTTASHNNQINGWTTDGEELIRERAKASIRVRYLKTESAMAEAANMSASREPFLSALEKMAFQSLHDETFDAASTGKVRPYRI